MSNGNGCTCRKCVLYWFILFMVYEFMTKSEVNCCECAFKQCAVCIFNGKKETVSCRTALSNLFVAHCISIVHYRPSGSVRFGHILYEAMNDESGLKILSY